MEIYLRNRTFTQQGVLMNAQTKHNLFTNQLPRDCDNVPCPKDVYPKGDGSTPHVRTKEGGKYFCSNDCEGEFVEKQADKIL